MQITRMASTKYYLSSLLGALMVALGVLAVAPSAQAQPTDPITVDKECTPNPVQVGQPLICTIDVEPASPDVFQTVQVSDDFPSGVRPIRATVQQISNGEVISTGTCGVTGNTVSCPPTIVVGTVTLRVTIDATADQCGTFTNTARAFAANTGGGLFTAPEEITVEGCEVPPPGPQPASEPGQQQPNQQQGSPAPITQEGEQESEAGEIDQSFDVS